jgi:hypothetical protein
LQSQISLDHGVRGRFGGCVAGEILGFEADSGSGTGVFSFMVISRGLISALEEVHAEHSFSIGWASVRERRKTVENRGFSECGPSRTAEHTRKVRVIFTPNA